MEENQLIDDINKDLRILEELATLVLCIKDGITIEDIENYVCPNIIPILEKNDIVHTLAKLFEGTKSSYLIKEEPILHVLKELEKTNLDKFMAITSILSKLPLIFYLRCIISGTIKDINLIHSQLERCFLVLSLGIVCNLSQAKEVTLLKK